MRKRGMRTTTAGTIMVDRKSMKSPSRPGNSRRAKAYPAVAEVATWPAATAVANTSEFRK